MCKLTKEEEYSIISRTMTNIRSLHTYVRELDFEQLLDMQEKLNTVIEDAVKMLNEKRLNVRNWKLNVNRYLSSKRLTRTVLIFTESSDQLSRATDRVPGLPASPGYVQ